MNKPEKILITGAAGFIGSHLAERLLNLEYEVTGIDNFDEFYDPAIKRSNIKNCLDNSRFRFFEADIRNPEVMAKIITPDISCVVHLAAKAGVRPSIENPLLYNDVNINGTMNILEALRSSKIRKLIFASSSSVYGNNRKVPFSESDNVDFPISPYAATKKAGELLCHTYHKLYNIDITGLRFFTVYGPRQRPDLAIHKFSRLILDGRPIPVYGDGSMRRDFTYIDDIIDGIVNSIERCNGYNIYNLGESRPVSVNELITHIENALGTKAVRQQLPEQPGDVKCTYADVSKAVKELKYTPSTKIEDGLEKFAEWLRNA